MNWRNQRLPLLSIAIPTYNRAKYLDRNLGLLRDQLKHNYLDVEVIVFDNHSNDDTPLVVEKYLKFGFGLKYFRNEVNMGPDYNIAQCYSKSVGKYVLALADDDLLVSNSIDKILSVLKYGEYGVVYLSGVGLNKISKNYSASNQGQVKLQEFLDPFAFLKKVNYFITFISANIVNRMYLEEGLFLRNMNTNLVQVPFILNAIISSSKNAVICDILLGVQEDNSGGYNLFEVFGRNFNSVIENLLVEKNFSSKEKVLRLINNQLLTRFFPYWILKLREGNHLYVMKKPISELNNAFRRYSYFWLFNYPISKSPLITAKLLYMILRGYNFIIRRLTYINLRRHIIEVTVKY